MEIITREQARERCLTHYYTGEPCKRGHFANRQVSDRGCCECKRDRAIASFSKNPEKHRAYAASYREKNKDKARASSLRYVAANKEKVRLRQAKYRAENRDRLLELNARYRSENSDRELARAAAYRAKNRGKELARCARYRKTQEWVVAYRKGNNTRRARKLQAMPPWFGELDDFVWEEAAHLATLREKATGIKWHCDHMMPLACRKACGLHVWNNVQVIPARINEAKKNKFILTEPLEWLQHL